MLCADTFVHSPKGLVMAFHVFDPFPNRAFFKIRTGQSHISEILQLFYDAESIVAKLQSQSLLLKQGIKLNLSFACSNEFSKKMNFYVTVTSSQHLINFDLVS